MPPPSSIPNVSALFLPQSGGFKVSLTPPGAFKCQSSTNASEVALHCLLLYIEGA